MDVNREANTPAKSPATFTNAGSAINKTGFFIVMKLNASFNRDPVVMDIRTIDINTGALCLNICMTVNLLFIVILSCKE